MIRQPEIDDIHRRRAAVTVLARMNGNVVGVIDRRGPNFKITRSSAEWGSLPLEGGVKAAYKHEIESAPDPLARCRAGYAHSWGRSANTGLGLS